MQRRIWTFAIAVGCLLWLAAPAQAITIFERGKTEPTRGKLLAQTGASVTIEESLADGTVRQRTIPKTEIEDSIDPVSAERLGSLAPDQPQNYRNYAEELAEKRVDPDAQAAAIRLYLMAAWLDPENLAESSLLGMTALARSPAEERKFRAMAYLYDPDHDRRALRTAEPAAAAAAAPVKLSESRESLLRALQLRRRGNRRAALLNLGRDGVKAELEKSGLITEEEFSQAGLPDSLLRKIVALELSIASGDAAAEKSTVTSHAWSQIEGDGGAAAPAPSLRLETLTEFDPRLCVYRTGKWVAPEP